MAMVHSMPEDVNPSFDLTGERCGYGQSGPVFFLPGNTGEEALDFRCVVAEGTALYVSVRAQVLKRRAAAVLRAK